MRQKRALLAYFSITTLNNELLLLNANWEAWVIISASSSMISFRFKFLHNFSITKKAFCSKRSFLSHFWPHLFPFHHLHSARAPSSCSPSCTGPWQVLWWLTFFRYQEGRRRADSERCWTKWSFWLNSERGTSWKDALMRNEVGKGLGSVLFNPGKSFFWLFFDHFFNIHRANNIISK